MAEKVKEISHIPTLTSAEALIYENGLIKQLSPRYNVALRDDKSYPMLKLTAKEKYPRLIMTRQRKNDGAIYYGPYANAKLLRQALGILRRLFPLRTCNKMPKRLCLNYHISQCLGPCEGKTSEGAYGDAISELRLFLEGKREELLGLLSKKMALSAASEDFETAAALRNRIEALSAIKEKRVSYNPADEMEELKGVLGLKGKLETIEAFDVSNIMGKFAVGSMVYFYKGRPRKSEYRKFRINTVSGIDDYSMIRELVNRRYKRLLDEKKGLPGLILIDGGKGHLGVALEELKRLGLDSIPAIGIAKRLEHIYIKDRNDPLVLPRESKALHLLMRIRDEAHRFAISYHKGIFSKNASSSELDSIKGIGEKRKKALIVHFGSIDNIRKAALKELSETEGMNEKSARSIIEYFKGL